MDQSPPPRVFATAFSAFGYGLLLVGLIFGSVVGLVILLASLANYSNGYDSEEELRYWFVRGALVFAISLTALLGLLIREVRVDRRRRRANP